MTPRLQSLQSLQDFPRWAPCLLALLYCGPSLCENLTPLDEVKVAEIAEIAGIPTASLQELHLLAVGLDLRHESHKGGRTTLDTLSTSGGDHGRGGAKADALSATRRTKPLQHSGRQAVDAVTYKVTYTSDARHGWPLGPLAARREPGGLSLTLGLRPTCAPVAKIKTKMEVAQ